ncbi:MAG: EAL domain-containing protein, partial [Pseudomonadota bacterium]
NPEFASQLITRLREVGASVWLTDFARRTSALPNLDNLNVDGIRFDERLTAGGAGTKHAKMLSALFNLAISLEARVMVGGVMDLAEANDLHALGARYAVGPAFGRPVNAQAAPGLAIQHAEAAE